MTLVPPYVTTQKKWHVKTGDLFKCGSHRIICGDCTSEHVVKQLLGRETPHLMVTDPPYGVEYEPSWRKRVTRENGSSAAGFALGIVTNDHRADWHESWELFPGDVCYVWHAGKNVGIVAESLNRAGFQIRSQIIWAKSHFVISRGHYHWKHEPCLYAVRKGATAHWHGDRRQHTLWQIPKPQKSETGMSTQKPIDCMAQPIKNNSVIGDIVYDPFAGSGTTLIACEVTNRKCRTIEINPEYVALALERWAHLTGGNPSIMNN